MGKKICTWSEDINYCNYFIRETLECKKEKRHYQKEAADNDLPDQYIRKERWYEKYYK